MEDLNKILDVSIENLVPTGPRVLLEVKIAEEVAESGIIIRSKKLAEEDELTMEIGTVVAIGDIAYHDWAEGKPWIAVGDTVMFIRYTGKAIKLHGKTYRVLNDEDVILKVKKGDK